HRGHWVLTREGVVNSVAVADRGQDVRIETLFSALSLDTCHGCNAVAFATSNTTDNDLSVLWHCRLGHPGVRALAHLAEAGEGVPSFLIGQNLCETCRLAKATELVSRARDREIPEDDAFHRVSCDILQLEPGYNGDEYVVHFQCFKTAFNLVFCEPRRGGIANVFHLFLVHVQTQYNKTVRIIRIDNESAVGENVKNLLKVRGIHLENSAPHTPAQNGHAERHGRSIVTKARALRLSANLPHNLWPEIVKTTAYLLNRTPTRKIGWKTPFEALFKRKPRLSHLHTIGSKCYWLNHNTPKKLKLNA